MSENWAICLFGSILTVMTIVLAWIATEVRAISGEIRRMVSKDDCQHDMDIHCTRIENISKLVNRNAMDIIALQQAVIGNSVMARRAKDDA